MRLSVALDKKLHFLAGALIGALCFGVTGEAALGLAGAFAAGLAKETWDLLDPDDTWDDVEVWDLVATCLGGLLAVGVIYFSWVVIRYAVLS